MTAILADLDYDTSYNCVAFSVTSENKTYYGETQIFRTDKNPSGVHLVKSVDNIYEVARYDMQGKKLNSPQPGLNIIRMSDGKTKKVVIR